ncbi:hypothetical protein BDP27DRAFT_1406399 [Rhodocollybia butyracea]|uniref:HNH nuclease domain-containing protein n=1 Tax=Rhodocollybia butyracea TaxID=206335 RepID=A0A9P5U0P2_9AGAR|nr:hypothetical protein BDP27DRAFT_1406399 [Rhodocollybia butyracea]
MVLVPFTLPLANGAPPGYEWANRSESATSSDTAFDTGIDQRDCFRGTNRCVVCGSGLRTALQRCYGIPKVEKETWNDLKRREWIPMQAKNSPAHEPRNGLLMCATHQLAFEGLDYFIRYMPDARKFILINYNNERDLAPYHGKALALDTGHRYSPFPSVFIIHEMRVRGRHPFTPVIPDVDIEDDPPFQDWIVRDGLFDPNTRSFVRAAPRREGNGHGNKNNSNSNNNDNVVSPMPGVFGSQSTGQGQGLPLNNDVIRDILQATHQMESWKACQIEGTDWSGTAENIKKYQALSEK